MPSIEQASKWAAAALALSALTALTGGFGLLVPRIHGLEECGDYLGHRLFLSAPIAVTLAYLGLLGHASRSPGGRLFALSPVVFCASVGPNVAGGRDPLGAWLDWRARHIDYAAIDPGTESAGCYPIENHEHIWYDPDGGLYRAGGA